MEDFPRVPERTERPRLVIALAALAGYSALGGLLFGFAGVAGWRGGWLLAILWFSAGGGALAWAALGPPVQRPVAGRGFYVAALVLLGLVAAARCVAVAPESKGRLAQRLDALPLDFWESTGERRTGHGWCRPTCSTVTRTYRGPHLQPRAAKVHAATALANQRLLPDIQLLIAQRQNERLDDETEDTIVRARMRIDPDGRARLTITLVAKR